MIQLPPVPVIRVNSVGAFSPNSYSKQVGGRLRLDLFGEVNAAIGHAQPHRLCMFIGKPEARAIAQQLLEFADND